MTATFSLWDVCPRDTIALNLELGLTAFLIKTAHNTIILSAMRLHTHQLERAHTCYSVPYMHVFICNRIYIYCIVSDPSSMGHHVGDDGNVVDDDDNAATRRSRPVFDSSSSSSSRTRMCCVGDVGFVETANTLRTNHAICSRLVGAVSATRPDPYTRYPSVHTHTASYVYVCTNVNGAHLWFRWSA